MQVTYYVQLPCLYRNTDHDSTEIGETDDHDETTNTSAIVSSRNHHRARNDTDKKRSAHAASRNDNDGETKDDGKQPVSWRCDRCTFINVGADDTDKCSVCGASRTVTPSWQCAACAWNNDGASFKCKICLVDKAGSSVMVGASAHDEKKSENDSTSVSSSHLNMIGNHRDGHVVNARYTPYYHTRLNTDTLTSLTSIRYGFMK